MSTFTTASERFSWFNKARACSKLEAARVCRALSVLQAHDGSARLASYHATVRGCSCPDRQSHPTQACKHMVARMIEARACERRQTDFAAFSAALHALESKRSWFSGETLALTAHLLAVCTGDDVRLQRESDGAWVSIFSIGATGWQSWLGCAETDAAVNALWSGETVPASPRLAFGRRVR